MKAQKKHVRVRKKQQKTYKYAEKTCTSEKKATKDL